MTLVVAIGIGAAMLMLAVIIWSIRYPDLRRWPPKQSTMVQRIVVWAHTLTDSRLGALSRHRRLELDAMACATSLGDWSSVDPHWQRSGLDGGLPKLGWLRPAAMRQGCGPRGCIAIDAIAIRRRFIDSTRLVGSQCLHPGIASRHTGYRGSSGCAVCGRTVAC